MMRPVARMFVVALLALASFDSAMAQNLDQIIRDIGRLGQPSRASIQAEWDKIASDTLSCIDDRLRRARRSVNTLIDRGIGPADSRVVRIVGECQADAGAQTGTASPSFNCRIARQPDERAICGDPELARLDRAVVEGYDYVLGREGPRLARGIADPLLRQRHACGPDIDCIRQVQLTAIAAFQARGAPVQVPAAAQVTAPADAAYVVNGMPLGGNVVGSADYRDFACAPSPHHDGFTECQRQTAERSRRRRISESTSLLHAADGSAAYINQSFEPVVMGDEDADDDIARLSQTFGKATLLPLTDARGVRTGVIATWGAVSLLPLEPERRQALATGTNDDAGILIDHVGNPQRSAQAGLPVYRIGGGAGYVWSASWNGRGRGTLRMLTIDASKLPGAVAEAAKPAAEPVAPAPTAAAGAPAAVQNPPVPEAPKPAVAAPAPKPAESAPVAASPPPAVRVVGPPIELRPNASATTSTSTPASSGSGNGLVYFLVAMIVVLLGAVGYLYQKSRVAQSGPAVTAPAAPDAPAPTLAPATAATSDVAEAPAGPVRPDAIAVPESKMDLSAMVPAESPDSIAGSKQDIVVPKDAAMTPDAVDGEKQDRADRPAAAAGDK